MSKVSAGLKTILAAAAFVVVASGAVLGQRLGSAAAEAPSEISAGGFHTCTLSSAGGVKCWGDNAFGQLGDGTTADSSVPVAVVGLGTAIDSIAAGGSHTCALTALGGVVCWGQNGFGQLGDGTLADRASPVDVSGLSGGVVAISAGGFHTCALMSSGGVKCWGQNNRGQLGDGTTVHRSTPVDVLGLPEAAAAVSAGGSELLGGGHTCAATESGGASCWGRNDFGQLGDGTTTDASTATAVAGLAGPTQTVHAGRWHTCVLTASSNGQCWGWNIGGQLGDGTNSDSHTPTSVSGIVATADAMTAGGSHNCALVDTSGVKCWGVNDVGQVGDGTTSNQRNSPVDVLVAPGGSPLLGVAAVDAGGSISTSGHTCAIMDSGGVKCWGNNSDGQLGDGTSANRSTPVDVVGFASKQTETPTATQAFASTATPTSTSAPTSTPTPTPTPLPPTVEEALDALSTLVDDLEAPRGAHNSLLSKLDAAVRQAARANWCAASNAVGAFVHEIGALLRSGRISADDASALIAQAMLVMELLQSEGDCRA